MKYIEFVSLVMGLGKLVMVVKARRSVLFVPKLLGFSQILLHYKPVKLIVFGCRLNNVVSVVQVGNVHDHPMAILHLQKVGNDQVGTDVSASNVKVITVNGKFLEPSWPFPDVSGLFIRESTGNDEMGSSVPTHLTRPKN